MDVYKELLIRGYCIDFDMIISDGIKNLCNKIYENLDIDIDDKCNSQKFIIMTCYDPNYDLKIKL